MKGDEMDQQDIDRITNELTSNGWNDIQIGMVRSNNITSQIKGFKCFLRKKSATNPNQSHFTQSKNPVNTRVTAVGSNPTMGTQSVNLTPTQKIVGNSSVSLAAFDNYQSLVNIRNDDPCLLIGYDSEWQSNIDGSRDMLSWQFSIVINDDLYEICFLRTSDDILDINIALGFIFGYLDLKSVLKSSIIRYMYCTDWDDDDKPIISVTDYWKEAYESSVFCYVGYGKGVNKSGWSKDKIVNQSDRKDPNREWSFFHRFLDFKCVDSYSVCLVCHFGRVDISGLSGVEYLMRSSTEVQGGLVTMQPVRIIPKDITRCHHTYVYPVSLSFVDSMCHAPAGRKSLERLGAAVGVHKLDIDSGLKSDMLNLLINNPVLYMDYAATDSTVTLYYISAVYGWNNKPGITVTSATSTVMKGIMMDYLKCDNTDDFNRKYRGLQRVKHGKFVLKDRVGYVDATSLEPLSDKVNSIQHYCSHAYHGGYNSCSEVGYFGFNTYDYDLENAYPTAMVLVPDIDWDNPVKFQIINQPLTLQHFQLLGGIFNPTVPFVCYCRFEFPSDVKYPCIPVNVDGVPIYPRTSDGLSGVYVAGAYVYLALRLGATVYCETGYFLNTLLNDDFTESRSLSSAVVQLVQDRTLAKANDGKGSLTELILKTMVNSGYGKNAQNVVDKSSWKAFTDTMESLGCSSITNPFSAMMITSIVQCELLAAQNQLDDLGFVTCSVTTDGFITNCDFDTLKSLDLYGFSPFMKQARLFLTGGISDDLWDIKHTQDDLVNFCTRGNVSLLDHGVCAHNSAKSGLESDSYDDRLWLMKSVLGRNGAIPCVDRNFTSFKDMVQKRSDLYVTLGTRNLRMDFDLKRKPDRNSFVNDIVTINTVAEIDLPSYKPETFEIAHFDTVAYESVEEFRLYRRKKELCVCLRTLEEWDLFFLKIDTNACGMHVKDLDWAIIVSVVMGYRSGKFDIPKMDNLSVADKCAFINTFNDSKRCFKPSDWKNCRRPERQVNMLPDHFLASKLSQMIV